MHLSRSVETIRCSRVGCDFEILAETEEYAVVEKPPFLLVHPTKPGGPPTLWSELKHLFAFEIANGGQISIINRLDRETSGLMLVAKTGSAARKFNLLMQQQRLEKEYLAIVFGWPTWKRKIVDAPLARQGVHSSSSIWLKRAIHPQGAPAVTEFVVERQFIRSTPIGDRFSVIRAVPKTGRTHQIRVHLASVGHPIVGDKLYGANEQHYLRFIETGWTSELEEALLLPRQALHSSRLKVDQHAAWRSSLPADLENWIVSGNRSQRSLFFHRNLDV